MDDHAETDNHANAAGNLSSGAKSAESISLAIKNFCQLTQEILDQKAGEYNATTNIITNNLNYIHHEHLNMGRRLADVKWQPKTSHEHIISEYDAVLRESIRKLQDTAKNDFEKINDDFIKFTYDAKNRIRNAVENFLKDQSAQKDFADVVHSMLINVHQKIKEDFQLRNQISNRKTSDMKATYSGVFVSPSKKPTEEIQAEKLLQQYFEQQLLSYKNHLEADMDMIQEKFKRQITATKNRISTNLEENVLKKNAASKSVPNEIIIHENVGLILTKVNADFQEISEKLKNNVEANKRAINEKILFVAEKVIGKEMLGIDENDED